MKKDEYDVIIIGAGIGGLTAASYLAQNNLNVLVVEKNEIGGGYAMNFKRKGIEFDSGLHQINGCGEGEPAHKVLKEIGLEKDIKFYKHEYLMRSVSPGCDIRIPQSNLKIFVELLARIFPGEKKGLVKLINVFEKIFNEIYVFFNSNNSPKLEMLLFPFKYPHLILNSKKSAQDLLNKFIKNKKLQEIITQLWPYFGLPPSKLNSLYFSYAWYDFYAHGGYYPEGGGQAIAESLIKKLKQFSGKIIFNSEVVKIKVENFFATSITLKNEQMHSARAFIINMDPYLAFKNLIAPNLKINSYLDKMSQMEESISAFVVYLILGKNLKDYGIFDYEIFLNTVYDSEKQYDFFEKNDLKNAAICITIYSNLPNYYNPGNKTVLSITILSGYDFWRKLSNLEYKEKKEKVTKSLIKKASTLIPEIEKNIEFCESATPLTMERYTSNHKGAIYGWSQSIDQCGLKRLKRNTPIKNIYLASAWTQPGAGISIVMLSGLKTAKKVLKSFKGTQNG